MPAGHCVWLPAPADPRLREGFIGLPDQSLDGRPGTSGGARDASRQAGVPVVSHRAEHVAQPVACGDCGHAGEQEHQVGVVVAADNVPAAHFEAERLQGRRLLRTRRHPDEGDSRGAGRDGPSRRGSCAEALEADASRKADDAMDQLPGGGTRGRVAGRSGHDQRFERTVYHGYVIGGESHWP